MILSHDSFMVQPHKLTVFVDDFKKVEFDLDDSWRCNTAVVKYPANKFVNWVVTKNGAVLLTLSYRGHAWPTLTLHNETDLSDVVVAHIKPAQVYQIVHALTTLCEHRPYSELLTDAAKFLFLLVDGPTGEMYLRGLIKHRKELEVLGKDTLHMAHAMSRCFRGLVTTLPGQERDTTQIHSQFANTMAPMDR